MQWLEHPAIKWAIPLPLLALIAPLVWLFFRATWRELDAEALVLRRDLAARREIDYRPMLALTLVALILTLHEYYGRPDFYDRVLRPALQRRSQAHPGGFVNLELYDELYVRIWWGLTRIGGYLAPLAVWPLFFRRDRLADFGLRTRGFLAHAWIYALCVAVMVPVLLIVSRQPDFAAYYPMYKLAGRSWLDFAIWELVYVGQFFALEIFFRGFWLRAMRSFGSGAIWSMVVPYCMIHYGKPYLEACAARGGGRRAGVAGHAHAQHLCRLSGPRHGGHPDGRAGALPAARAAVGAHAAEHAPSGLPLLEQLDLDRLGPGARRAGLEDLATYGPRPSPCGGGPGFELI